MKALQTMNTENKEISTIIQNTATLGVLRTLLHKKHVKI